MLFILGKTLSVMEKKISGIYVINAPLGGLLDRGCLIERGVLPKILFRRGRLLDTGRLLEAGRLLDHLRYLTFLLRSERSNNSYCIQKFSILCQNTLQISRPKCTAGSVEQNAPLRNTRSESC